VSDFDIDPSRIELVEHIGAPTDGPPVGREASVAAARLRDLYEQVHSQAARWR
jgi:hypothetical protein